MGERMKAEGNNLYTLIPLEDFKGLLSVDDRDDRLAQFCLVTATHTIEQYCKRRLLRKKHFEQIEFYGDLVLPLIGGFSSNAFVFSAISSTKTKPYESFLLLEKIEKHLANGNE